MEGGHRVTHWRHGRTCQSGGPAALGLHSLSPQLLGPFSGQRASCSSLINEGSSASFPLRCGAFRRSSRAGEKQTTEERRSPFRFSRSRNKTTPQPAQRARARRSARPACPPPPPPPTGSLLGARPLRVKRERCKGGGGGGRGSARGANVTKRLREKLCTIYKSGGGGATAREGGGGRGRRRLLWGTAVLSGGSGGKVAAGAVPAGENCSPR